MPSMELTMREMEEIQFALQDRVDDLVDEEKRGAVKDTSLDTTRYVLKRLQKEIEFHLCVSRRQVRRAQPTGQRVRKRDRAAH